MLLQVNGSSVYAYTGGTYTFSTAQTGLPYITQAGGAVGGATVGFPYASFLLGLVDVAVSFSWLLTPGRGLRDAAAVLFAVELAATALAATVTARVVLWR